LFGGSNETLSYRDRSLRSDWIIVRAHGFAFDAARRGCKPLATECEALDGQYIKDGPDSRCELPPTKPGRNPPGEQGSESQTTLEGQGNLNNKQETFCEGNKGQCKNPG
jgi:hypothetical protein